MDKHHVLLIEDDQNQAEWIASQIEFLMPHLNVVIASNGLEGIMYICNHPRQSLLVLLDLDMPVMDGFKFLEYVQCEQLMKRLNIAVLINDEHEHEIVQTLKYNVKEFLLKPIEYPQLAEFLARQLEDSADIQLPYSKIYVRIN